MTAPATLTVDIGGSGIKASVLGPDGAMLVDRRRVPTPYPLPPERLVAEVAELVTPLPAFDRVSVGFPGMVRGGVVLTAPNLSTEGGPGTPTSDELVAAWSGFDLAGALGARLGRPTRVVNDADLQGAAVVSGAGLELVVTLGTGFGTALYEEGLLCPHMELAHHPFRKGETYEEQLGDQARRAAGNDKWSRRVERALDTLYRVLMYDRVYVGGGNARKLTVDLGPRAHIVDNTAGILGGIRLWPAPPA